MIVNCCPIDSGVGCNDDGISIFHCLFRFKDLKGTKFVPNYPASSPFVTAVGGTATEDFFELGPEVSSSFLVPFSPKLQMVNELSGGGFSNFFPMPSWQKAAVSQYLSVAQDLPNPSFYNATGRAYPDVSALRYLFFYQYLD